jgi:ABC-type Fe3+ transport system permease subunit
MHSNDFSASAISYSSRTSSSSTSVNTIKQQQQTTFQQSVKSPRQQQQQNSRTPTTSQIIFIVIFALCLFMFLISASFHQNDFMENVRHSQMLSQYFHFNHHQNSSSVSN